MDNRGSLFFLLIVFYFFLNTQTRPPVIENPQEHQRELFRERDALHRLNESRYGDFDPPGDRWLPFAGSRKNDSYSWGLLPEAQDRARHQVRVAYANAGLEPPPLESDNALNVTQQRLPVYRNATSKLRGDWVRRQVDGTPSHLNITAIAQEHEYFTREFSGNITGDAGTFYVQLQEGGGEELQLDAGQAREIRAVVTVESNNFWGTTWYMPLLGVHFPKTGAILLSTSSEKYGGLFALPHMALSEHSYELTHQLLVKSLSDAISEKEHRPTLFPWNYLVGSEPMETPAPNCEHIVYLQQHPVIVDNYPANDLLIEQIEQELRFPEGAPIPSPPLMAMSAVMFSPDCGYILETKGAPDYPPSEALYLTGPKAEEFGKYSARLVFVISSLYMAQIGLLLRQIKEASTPSTRSRVSFYTLALLAFGDAFVLVFIVLELYESVSFLVITAVSFLTFLSVSYVGMKFMIDVYAVQAPERREQERQANPPTPPRPGLPLPATATRPTDTGATPVILTPDQDPPNEGETPPPRAPTPPQGDTRSDVGAMYARFYFVLFVLLILSIWSFAWPNRVKALYARTIGFIYLSFWIPQIYRNVMRNCRKALRWDFVIGQSALRVFPFAYFLTVRGNVLFIRPDWTTALALVGWVWLQVWVLASQDVLGPRFFVPRGWAPPAYDYHPILRDTADADDDLESGGTLPIGTLRAEERDLEGKDQDRVRSKDRKKAAFDCAICMHEMEVPVMAAPVGGSSVADGATSLLSRRNYMVTPCRHIFHSACLESWMRLRLQCPICRESIPPV